MNKEIKLPSARYERRMLKKTEKDKKKEELIFRQKLSVVIKDFIRARAYGLNQINISYLDFKYLNKYVTWLNGLYPKYKFVWWEADGGFGNISLDTKPYIEWKEIVQK